MIDKSQILKHIIDRVRKEVDQLQDDIRSSKESRDSNTKSTAGDKHEVGRAMAQIELENLEIQCQRKLDSLAQLEAIDLDRNTQMIGRGSLVNTTKGLYFISIGLGAIELTDQVVYIISPMSPIGNLIAGKKLGERFEFNGEEVEIIGIS